MSDDGASTPIAAPDTVALPASRLITKDVRGVEDSIVPLPISVGPVPPGHELTVEVRGVPTGATLSAGTKANADTWSLSPEELDNLSLTLPPDFNGKISLSVALSVVSREVVNVTVSPVADRPLLNVSNATGTEDSDIPIDIFVEANPHEELSIEVVGLPAGGTLSSGSKQANGNWTLAPHDLDQLSLRPPANFSGDAELVVAAKAVDGTDVAVVTETAQLRVEPEADGANLVALDVTGTEDQPARLDIDVTLPDPAEQLELLLSGVPAETQLSAGQEIADGTWRLTPEDLDNLVLVPATNANGAYPLTVTAVTTDGDSQATTEQVFQLALAPVADTPALSAEDAIGLEDEDIPLSVAASSTGLGETVSLKITGLPSGVALSAGDDLGGGEWELGLAELQQLNLQAPKDFNGQFELFAVARAVDGTDSAIVEAGFSVLIAPIAERPSLAAEDAAGDEDEPILLGINVSPAAAGEQLELTLGPFAAGTVLSAGRENGDGSWTLQPSELAGLSLTPPPNYNGSMEVVATAKATDGQHTAVAEAPFVIAVAPVADAPQLAVEDVFANEDESVRLTLRAEETGTGEIVDILLSGVPAGASLTKGTEVAAGEWLLQVEDLADLALLPPENYHGSFILAVLAAARDDGEETVSIADFRVSLAPVADPPVLKVARAEGLEDQEIPVELSIQQTDPSEELRVVVADLPDGAALSAGTKAEDGRWILSRTDLDDLKLIPPANDNGNFLVPLTATTISAGGEASATGTMEVSIAPVADLPRLALTNSTTLEDEVARLNITAEPAGLTDNLKITLLGLPAGARLSAGTRVGNDWELQQNELLGLELTPPPNMNGTLSMTVVASAADGDDVAAIQKALDVDIAPVADAPQLLVRDVTTDEDTPVRVGFDLEPAGGTEAVSVLISGLPDASTLSAGTLNSDGTWRLAASDMEGLLLTPPSNLNGVFGLTVTAFAEEDGAVDTAVVGEFVTVTVNPVADPPQVTVDDATAERGGPIPLNIGVTPSGVTERISVAVAGVPEDMVLSAGRKKGDGVWELEPSRLDGLTLTTPEDFRGTIELTIMASSTEPVGNDIAGSYASLQVQVGRPLGSETPETEGPTSDSLATTVDEGNVEDVRPALAAQQPAPDQAEASASASEELKLTIAPPDSPEEPSTSAEPSQASLGLKSAETEDGALDVEKLISLGDQHFENDDVVAARLFYLLAADSGSPEAAERAGMTYDPVVLSVRNTNPSQIDPALALSWYEKALERGAPNVSDRLSNLRAWSETQ